MRGRSIHARAILRQVGVHRNGASSIAPPPAVARASPSTRGFISTCESRSARPSARRAANASASASSSSSSKASSANSGSSASSAPSSGGDSSSSNTGAPAASKASKNGKSSTASASLVRDLLPKSKGVSSANPPPSSLNGVAWESFFANDRPLLQHELLPPKVTLHSTKMPGDSELSKFVFTDTLLGDSINTPNAKLKWRRRLYTSIEPERFDRLIDSLAGTEESAAASKAQGRTMLQAARRFRPTSNRVAIESAKFEEEERLKEEEEEAVYYALERGDSPEAARKLGVEADLVIVGEPDGRPNPEWTRGVALHLVENCHAYEPPAPPEPLDVTETEPAASMGEREIESVFFADSDPNLLLNYALVQTSLPLALKWDALVAKMDAAALHDSSKSTDGLIDLSSLNATLDVMLDSTRRKRKKKMRKHKYKKLRKLQRPERQKMKK